MRLEVLGHWAGAPADGGAASCYVVHGDTTLVLDVGPGALALLQERRLVGAVEAVLVSHMHLDHTLDLLPWATHHQIHELYGASAPRRPALYVPAATGRPTLSRLAAVWGRPNAASGRPQDVFAAAFDVREYSDAAPVQVGGLRLEPHRTTHGDECYAVRVSDGRVTLAYTADAGYTPGLVEHCRGADLLLAEATFAREDPYWTTEHGHLTGTLAGRLAAQAEVGTLVLTHLGPDREVVQTCLEDARREFDGTVEVARTGLIRDVGASP